VPVHEPEELLARLEAATVPFVVIGGVAAILYGSKCFTEDLDICMPFDRESLSRLDRALAGIHPTHRMTPARRAFELPAEGTSGFINLYLETDLGDLDCLGEVEGIGGYEAVRQVSTEVAGGRFRVLTLDALIRSKEALRREKDLLVLRELRAIRERR
jgi:hypothetical protein